MGGVGYELLRVLVSGSRAWPMSDAFAFEDELAAFLKPLRRWDPFAGWPIGPLVIVHGDCPTGLDYIAREWCIVNYVNDEPHPAEWGRFGRRAGHRRNAEMVELGADVGLFFPLGASPGTRGCLAMAEKAGIPVRVREGASGVGAG